MLYRVRCGSGYAHILGMVRDMTMEEGIDQKVYDSLLTDNVKRFLNL